MKKITAVLPARNCRRQLGRCLQALYRSQYIPEIIVVDDGSDDGTEKMVRRHWPSVTYFSIPAHTGYAHAANAGLRLVRTEYAFLIRPDLQPGRRCMDRLLKAMEDDRVFCALPVSPSSRGKKRSPCPVETLAAADGCALYRMQALEEIGWLDERHFAGLEALDLSLRGLACGHRTVEVPGAVVRSIPAHSCMQKSLQDVQADTGPTEPSPDDRGAQETSGADTFRRQLAAGNGIYTAYKNIPGLLRLLQLPVQAFSGAAQIASFAREGELGACRMALVRGRALCSLEKERRRALEDGVGIWPENLSDAAFLGMEEAACRIYPLFLAEKEPLSADRIPRYMHMHRLLMRDAGRLTALLCGADPFAAADP